MTKLIAIAIVAAALFAGWEFFLYWDQVQQEKDLERKREQAAIVTGDQLQGVPFPLQASLQVAQQRGLAGLRDWLQLYGQKIQDPRKAWIELDYCVLLSRDNVAAAKAVFKQVKERTPPTSPVWPRIKKLEKTYD
ncbi:conserved exported hypothetical protein [Verrucomicrobia bacterium]|nr:conserved exported hypothetical protein [Verrucomicrobiota bacterium]